MPAAAARAVRIESIRALYRQLPLTLGTSAAVALITGAVLAPHAGSGPVVVWLAGFAVMVGLRWYVRGRFMRLSDDAAAAPIWSWAAAAGSLMSGLLWGACSLLLMPPQAPYPLFVAFVVGGMCAGSITVNATHMASVTAFMLPAIGPLAAWFAWHGGDLALPMAAMTALYAGALWITAWRYATQFAAGVRARLELAERTEELAQANGRLRAEIAEREAAEAALRQSQKMEALGSLTAGVAHDVNNVLMVIRGAAEVLKHRLAHAPGHQRQVATILRATERGAAVARGLLTFARKEALTPAVVEVNTLLRGIATLLQATLGKSVHVALDLDAALPPVFIDRGALEHAVINLAINARDAMAEGGMLTFRTGVARLTAAAAAPELRAGAYVMIAVADTGTGMTTPVLARAIDPFFTTKPPGKGSGLGLSQVYGLIRQSGGAVRIESKPGAGTTVLLYVPPADLAQIAHDRPDEAAAAPEPLADRPALLHVVLLDDEDMVREVVAELLESAGHRVSAFAQAVDALRCVETDLSVALLITDLGLPDVPGEEVARRARLLRPSLPVAFITGYNDLERLADEPLQLRKPFSEADLLAMIAEAARQRSPAA